MLTQHRTYKRIQPDPPKAKPKPPDYFFGVQTHALGEELEKKAAAEAQQGDNQASWVDLVQKVSAVAMARGAYYLDTPRDVADVEELVSLVWAKLEASGTLYLNALDPCSWKGRSSDDLTQDGWAVPAWAYTMRVAKNILADAHNMDTEEAASATELFGERDSGTIEDSGGEVFEVTGGTDTPQWFDQTPELTIQPVPRQVHHKLSERLEEADISSDPKRWRPMHPAIDGYLRCGPHRASNYGIEMHRNAKEPNCQSLDQSRWWGRFDTPEDVTLEDAFLGTIQLEPLDDIVAGLSCSDWDWIRKIAECPQCGCHFVKQQNRQIYCQMPCSTR